MQTISFLTFKGGVGKTTSVIHLGASLANSKTKVLVIDFDPQGNLSVGYNIDFRNEETYTIDNFLNQTGNFRLKEKSKNLFVLPGSESLTNIKGLHKNSLADLLNILNENLPNGFNFDYCLLDCPPQKLSGDNLTLGEIALYASDFIISPVESEKFSIEGVNDLIPEYIRIKDDKPDLELVGFFFNKVDTRSRRFKKYKALLESSPAKDFMFKTFVRRDVIVDDAKEAGKTIFQINEQSRAALDYKAVIKEIKNRIKSFKTN